ncbi:MAG TPA: plastocyanin/azurin family copper-binding protein [Gaiellaceae bacterium]|nr:plastocyanin/azurin family copper-binding protein [Gaiellaceae bacterium]
MFRTLLISALVVVAVSIPTAATGSSQAPNVTLTGVVGPGFTISLKNADGTNVRHLDPGAYDIAVSDQAIEHNFHLSGPGVDMATDVEAQGTTTWTVTFVDGTYNFRCDPHAAQMKGSFTVGNVPPPPPPPGRLSGKVTAKVISLNTASGSRVRSVVENTYRLNVADSSNKQNFHLTGPGVNKKTSVKRKMRATWTIQLEPGKYTYRSDTNRRLKRTFTVTAKPA